MSITPQRPILDEYCWHHKSPDQPQNGGWSCEACYQELKAMFQRVALEATQHTPSYVSRFSFLRECVNEGLLTEAEHAIREEEAAMSTEKIRAVLGSQEVAA